MQEGERGVREGREGDEVEKGRVDAPMSGLHHTADHIRKVLPVTPAVSTGSPVLVSSTTAPSPNPSNIDDATADVTVALVAGESASPNLFINASMAPSDPALLALIRSVFVALRRAALAGLEFSRSVVGSVVGCPEGCPEGRFVGCVGSPVGWPVGCLEGCPVGCPVGLCAQLLGGLSTPGL